MREVSVKIVLQVAAVREAKILVSPFVASKHPYLKKKRLIANSFLANDLGIHLATAVNDKLLENESR
jgi:hypothetical protein